MPLNRIACPECGAGLKSATGFEPGQQVNCLKCEAAFTIDESTPVTDLADGETGAAKEWSYRNSWTRYAVLGVLIAVLGVLSYMLYEKKQKEREDERLASRKSEGPKDDVPPPPIGMKGMDMPMPKLPGPGVGVKGGGKGLPSPAVIPKSTEFPLDEAKKMIVGKWAAEMENGETHTIEYKEDGTFQYTAVKGGGPARTSSGTWKTTRALKFPVAPPEETFEFLIEWTVNGKPAAKDPSMYFSGVLRHRVLDPLEGLRPVGVFKKKPG